MSFHIDIKITNFMEGFCLKRLSLVFSLLLLFGVILVACGEAETSTDDSNNETVDATTEETNEDEASEEESEEEESGTYGLGDTAEVADVAITITNVSLTDERNEFADEDPSMVVKIEYELENNSDDEIPVGADLQVYDGTGNQANSYPLDNTLGSLKPGKKIQGVEHYGIEEGPIEIYFQPMFSLDEEAIFEIEVE